MANSQYDLDLSGGLMPVSDLNRLYAILFLSTKIGVFVFTANSSSASTTFVGRYFKRKEKRRIGVASLLQKTRARP
jgi:hypothetical protein